MNSIDSYNKIDALCYILFVFYSICLCFCFNDVEFVKLQPNEGARIWLFVGTMFVFYVISKILAKFLKSICIIFGKNISSQRC